MNLFFSLLLISNAWTREIILITHHQKKEIADLVHEILISQLSIPHTLIQIQSKEEPCRLIEESIWQICIEKDGNLKFPKIDHETIRRSFFVFNENQEES